MTVTWPTDLPTTPVTDGYRVNTDLGIIRTEMESGRARQRRHFLTPPRQVSLMWLMTDTEVERFRSFFYWDLNHGCDIFHMSLLTLATARSTTLRFIANSPPRISALALNLWEVSAQLEILRTELVTVRAPLFVNDNTFFAGLVTPLQIHGALFQNTSTFFAGDIASAAPPSAQGFGSAPFGSGSLG